MIHNNRFTNKQQTAIKNWLPCYKLERNRIIEGEIKKSNSNLIHITTQLKYDIHFYTDKTDNLTLQDEKLAQLRLNSLESLFNTITVNRSTVQKEQNLNYTREIVKQVYNNKYFIKGRILNPIKGGMAVGFCGVVAFLPMSYFTTSTIGRLNIFYIVSLDIKKNMIVVSQKNLNKRVHRILRKLASRLIFLNESNAKK